ncbi:MAG: hypothetical protein AABX70_06365 [Nanoarchaeota archaeon]
MKRFNLLAKNAKKGKEVRRFLEGHGFAFSKKPEFIASVGGDGTFLLAERKYPSIPKFLVKDSMICNQCQDGDMESFLQSIKDNQVRIESSPKLEAKAGKKKLLATNEVSIRNEKAIAALRFQVKINGALRFADVIGDGLVFATPFGSSGYFKSITRSTFKEGLGLAFNNPRAPLSFITLEPTDQVEIKVLRGTGFLSIDNDPKVVKVKKGSIIKIQQKKVSYARMIRR